MYGHLSMTFEVGARGAPTKHKKSVGSHKFRAS
jgi:hypothetical protein